jgi:hypothetical protein
LASRAISAEGRSRLLRGAAADDRRDRGLHERLGERRQHLVAAARGPRPPAARLGDEAIPRRREPHDHVRHLGAGLAAPERGLDLLLRQLLPVHERHGLEAKDLGGELTEERFSEELRRPARRPAGALHLVDLPPLHDRLGVALGLPLAAVVAHLLARLDALEIPPRARVERRSRLSCDPGEEVDIRRLVDHRLRARVHRRRIHAERLAGGLEDVMRGHSVVVQPAVESQEFWQPADPLQVTVQPLVQPVIWQLVAP